MDPKITNQCIREQIAAFRAAKRVDEFDTALDAAREVAECIDALSEWSARGGFLPTGQRWPWADEAGRVSLAKAARTFLRILDGGPLTLSGASRFITAVSQQFNR